MKIKIKNKYISKYKSGYPLIVKSYLEDYNFNLREGEIIDLTDSRGNFIASGYYGIQNKGIGWILSLKKDEKIDMKFFEDKIHKAFLSRKFDLNNTNAFRIFNGEADGVGGVTVDYYDGVILINWYSKGAYKFRDFFINSYKKMDNIRAIYQKKRYDKSGKYIDEDGFVLGEKIEFPMIIKENGVNYAVYLNDGGGMVGIFLDQRDVRKKIRTKYSRGKRVLNTFSYTGAFSVAAALGGADKTTSVDLANRSYAKTIEQMALNGIDYENHDIIVMDVFDYFKFAYKKNMRFDLVILDPPSYAKNKKRIFTASKNYVDLLVDAIKITEDNGVIVASTNASNLELSKFKKNIDDAFKKCSLSYEILEVYRLPNDFKVIKNFKEGNYLKVIFIRCLNA